MWKALIDTGSDMTAISPAIVAALRPMRIGTGPVGPPGGARSICYTYHVRLQVGGLTVRGRWFSLEAVGVQPATADVDVLIGLDVLLQIDMTWLGPQRLLLFHC